MPNGAATYCRQETKGEISTPNRLLTQPNGLRRAHIFNAAWRCTGSGDNARREPPIVRNAIIWHVVISTLTSHNLKNPKLSPSQKFRNIEIERPEYTRRCGAGRNYQIYRKISDPREAPALFSPIIGYLQARASVIRHVGYPQAIPNLISPSETGPYIKTRPLYKII